MPGIHHLLTACSGMNHYPLPSVDRAWELFVRAEARDEAATTDVLMYPLTGIWISHMLRRLDGVVTEQCPLWMDVGYLHSLSAAAAIRSGVDFALAVPVRAGTVVLPTLGAATVGDAETAEVRRVGDDVTVSAGGRTVRLDADDPHWRPAPRCSAESDGLRIEFLIDDVDPYRDMRGYSAPDPLDRDDLNRWQQLLTEAWQLLVRQDRVRAESVAASLSTVIPLPAAKPWRPLSASCDEAFAAIMASMPDDAEQLAATLVHETQHVKLGALLHLMTFVDDLGGPLAYAPWRDDPRPLSGILQGIYAFIGITDFWRHRATHIAEYEFALWRIQLANVLGDLRADPRLTDAGRDLLANLHATVTGWADVPVAADILRQATWAAADHRGQWRAFHLAPPAEWVDLAASAWTAGEPCPAIPAGQADPVTDTSARWLDARAVLARIRLADPDQFTILAKAPGEIASQVPGTLPADLALIAEDAQAAQRGYLRDLTIDPTHPRALVGLGLAREALGEPLAVLLERPEAIRALAGRIDRPHIVALAEWMDGTLPLAECVDISTISNLSSSS
ncbi:HEXXH motif domain-containing protein [Actinoplanes sp. NPDC049668]|uniref:HEXXH motif domain-containing protein n=1 Tax=unclassified Actinoplanes TaxID=2626549 RepID=UPI0033A83C8A